MSRVVVIGATGHIGTYLVPRLVDQGREVTEDEPRTAYGAYGTGKAEIEALLYEETRAGGVPSVVLHPGHISEPGWPVITPTGNLDPATWTALATGQPLALPDHGLGVLHHVHADDVAQAFELALSRPGAAST